MSAWSKVKEAEVVLAGVEALLPKTMTAVAHMAGGWTICTWTSAQNRNFWSFSSFKVSWRRRREPVSTCVRTCSNVQFGALQKIMQKSYELIKCVPIIWCYQIRILGSYDSLVRYPCFLNEWIFHYIPLPRLYSPRRGWNLQKISGRIGLLKLPRDV